MTRPATKKLSIFLLLIIYVSLNVQAQQTGITLAQQYNDVVVKAGSFKGFKEIKEARLQELWRNIIDSLQRERQLLNETKAKLISNGQTVIQSKAELKNVQEELKQSQARVNEVSFFGIYLAKGTYNIIMWGLVLLLAAALALAIQRTKASLTEARYRSGLYNELSEEYRDYKVKANEKEKKLARELQTELNKVAELTAR